MKQIKKGLCGILALTICISVMTGCVSNPNKGAVTSKNDGVFEQNMTVAATAPLDEEILYTDTFTSHDGTAEYTINLDQELTSDPLPIVEVVPHFFTGEEVKKVCDTLLGEAEWREQVRESDPEYSKSEVQYKLNWMSEIANADALRELFGGKDADEALDLLRSYMQYYTVQLEKASENHPRSVCDWNFVDSGTYDSYSDGSNVIYATTFVNDAEYYVYSVHRDKDDYKNSRLYVGLGNERDYLQKQYLRSKYLRTEKPTQEQVDALSEKAQAYLDQMGIGQWQIASASVTEKYVGDIPEYSVDVVAVPVLNGVPAALKQPNVNLHSEDANAPNYLNTYATFQFSANGDLFLFDLCAPIEVSTVINEGAATLSMADLVNKAKEHLSLSGVEETQDYMILSQVHEAPISCKVTVDNIEVALLRIKAPEKDFVYYYVPALAVYGKTAYFDKATNALLDPVHGADPNQSVVLFQINAVDGSIISGN